jgi:hypothetical protein
VIVLRRPTPFGGALVVPKHRRFDHIVWTERVLQQTVLAIVASANLLIIISRICSCWDSVRFGAIVGYCRAAEWIDKGTKSCDHVARKCLRLCSSALVRRAQLKIALDDIQPSGGGLPRKPPNHSKSASHTTWACRQPDLRPTLQILLQTTRWSSPRTCIRMRCFAGCAGTLAPLLALVKEVIRL